MKYNKRCFAYACLHSTVCCMVHLKLCRYDSAQHHNVYVFIVVLLGHWSWWWSASIVFFCLFLFIHSTAVCIYHLFTLLCLSEFPLLSLWRIPSSCFTFYSQRTISSFLFCKPTMVQLIFYQWMVDFNEFFLHFIASFCCNSIFLHSIWFLYTISFAMKIALISFHSMCKISYHFKSPVCFDHFTSKTAHWPVL